MRRLTWYRSRGESDATPQTPDRIVSFEITTEVTKDGDHVADMDVDDEDQGPVMGDVYDSIILEKTRRNPRKLSWLTTNMIVAYAPPVIEEAIPSTYRKAEISVESKMWMDVMMEGKNSLHKNDIWELTELAKEKKAICYKWVVAKK